MKKIFALTLVMVLSFSVAAMAATTFTNSGWVKYTAEKVGDADLAFKAPEYRVNFNGKVTDTTSFGLRWETGGALKRAFVATSIPSVPGTFTFGKQLAGSSPIGIDGYAFVGGEGGDHMSWKGTFSEVTVMAFYKPDGDADPAVVNSKLGFEADYKASFGTLGFNYESVSDVDDASSYSVEFDIPVGEKLSVYGEVGKRAYQDDANAWLTDQDVQTVGVKLVPVENVEAYAEYDVDTKNVKLDATLTINAVDWNINYAKAEGDDATIGFGVAVNF